MLIYRKLGSGVVVEAYVEWAYGNDENFRVLRPVHASGKVHRPTTKVSGTVYLICN